MTWYQDFMNTKGGMPKPIDCFLQLHKDLGQCDVMHDDFLSMISEMIAYDSHLGRCRSSYEHLGTAIAINKELTCEVTNVIGNLKSEILAMKKKRKAIHCMSNLLAVLNGIVYPGGSGACSGHTTDLKKLHGVPSNKGAYPAIPSSYEPIARLSIEYPEYFEGSFIDIGCGVGDKVLSWAFLSKKGCAKGIDHDWYPIMIARESMYGFRRCHQSNVDIQFECEDAYAADLSKYDRVYTYIPIEDRDLRSEFYGGIADKLPVGALWYECWGADPMYHTLKHGFKQVHGGLYKKVK